MSPHIPEAKFSIVVVNDQPMIQMPLQLKVVEAFVFRDICHRWLENSPVSRQLILDFSQTQFIDSSGAGSLVQHHNFNAAKSYGVELVLYHVHPSIMVVLSMTGLDEVFPIIKTLNTGQTAISSTNNLQPPETHPSVSSWMKRSIDIMGGIVGFGITGVLSIPIIIAIKLDGPGAIFFKQTRCGWLGKLFKIIKFLLCMLMQKPRNTKFLMKHRERFYKK